MSSKPPAKEAETAKNHGQPPSSNTTTTTNTTKNKDKEEPSLLTRIQNSASSLIQDSFSRPSGANLSTDLAHVLESGNKGSSFPASSSGASTYSGQTWRRNGLGSGDLSSSGRQ